MPTSFVWNGLIEAQAELKEFPAALTAEAGEIVDRTTTEAVAVIKAAYPLRSGNLRNHVYARRVSGSGLFRIIAEIRSAGALAWIFENGTAARHYVTIGGKKHLTGRMPPGHVFVPRVIRARRTLVLRLAALLERAGLVVRIDAAA